MVIIENLLFSLFVLVFLAGL